MNETLQVIKSRRSIRKFKPEQLKDAELEAVLDAGAYAPSSANQQPWHFTVVQNQTLLDRISDAVKVIYTKMEIPFLQGLGRNPEFHLYFHAPSVVVISGDQSAMSPDLDGAMATQNMMLAAESLGIGSCWVSGLPHLFEAESGKELIGALKLPAGYKPVCAIALGYKVGESPKAEVRKENAVNYVR